MFSIIHPAEFGISGRQLEITWTRGKFIRPIRADLIFNVRVFVSNAAASGNGEIRTREKNIIGVLHRVKAFVKSFWCREVEFAALCIWY